MLNYKKSGDVFCVEIDIVPIADERGWYTHWVYVQRDVTARTRLESEAATRELQRTESIGTVSIGIAHYFNNIIASILGNIVLGRHEVQDGQNALRALEQINLAAERASGLVQQILSYARREKQALVRQPEAPLLRLSADLLRAALPAGVSITVTVAAADLDILADATQLDKIILNLGTNAWHAMKGRPGRIDMRLFTLDEAGHSEKSPTRLAVIEIEDNGVGMDTETLAQAFDPYFKIKAIGHGKGLGLSVVCGIVKAHGGTITVESVMGRGTVFRLRLPVLGNEGDSVQQIVLPSLQHTNPAATEKPHGANRMVLVVDDDDVVLQMLEGVLKRAEFRVMAFATAGQAIDAVRADPFAFDAVVTDMNMPEVSGLQLARAVALIREGLPVVLGSGFVSEELAADGLAAGVAGVYRNEQSPDLLPRLLCDVMDARLPGRTVLPA